MQLRRRFLEGAATAVGGVAFVRAAAKGAAFEYRLGHDQLASHPLGVAANEFAAAVRRESNGRLDVTVFPDNQLGSDPSMVLQIQAGALDMLLEGVAPISAIVPISQIGSAGFAFQTWKIAEAAMDGAVGTFIRNGLAAKGIASLEKTWPVGFVETTTWNRAIRTADDVAGLRLRVSPSAIGVDMWKTLGASPVPVSSNELYTALQTHLVDGNVGPFVDFYSRKTFEVQKFLSATNHQFAVYYFLINGEKWKALPADLQQIVGRNANRLGARESRACELQNEAAADQLVRLGMQLNRVDYATFRSKLGAYYGRWKNEFGAAAWTALERYVGRLT